MPLTPREALDIVRAYQNNTTDSSSPLDLMAVQTVVLVQILDALQAKIPQVPPQSEPPQTGPAKTALDFLVMFAEGYLEETGAGGFPDADIAKRLRISTGDGLRSGLYRALGILKGL